MLLFYRTDASKETPEQTTKMGLLAPRLVKTMSLAIPKNDMSL